MTKYTIAYSDGYWEVYDGTMIDNGSPFPFLSHKDKKIIFEKIMTYMLPGDKLDIYNQYGKLEKSLTFKQ